MRAADSVDAGAPRLPRRRRRPTTSTTLLDVLPPRPQDGGTLRRRHRPGAAPHAGEPEVRLPRRARSGRACAPGTRLSRCATSSSRRGCRSSCGAAFRTTSCWTLADRGAADGACRRSTVRCGGCWRDPKAQSLVDNFAGQWLQLRNLRNKQPNSHEFPDFDDNLRAGAADRDGAVLRVRHARGPQRPRPDDGRLHVRQRAAGAALRHPRRLRQPLPPRHADRRRAARPARQGRDPDGHVARAPHVAGAARQVGAREHARRAAAAAARRACRRSRRRSRPRKPRSVRERHRAASRATRRAPAATG